MASMSEEVRLGVEEYLEIDEGIEPEETAADEDITKPFDPNQIRLRRESQPVTSIMARVAELEVDLSPAFQRRAGLWSDRQQSRLIESLLIRIPLPAFYMDASDDDQWLVVDGLQRLHTLKRYILDQDLRLRGMEFLKSYEGMRYDELPRGLRRRIDETQLVLYLIEEGTPINVKYNIFKRINTGGLPLSAQEIRHALNQGPANDVLARLASGKAFQKATGGSVSGNRMGDQECALRGLAFLRTDYRSYKENRGSGFDEFLNRAMDAVNLAEPHDVQRLEERFERAMNRAADLFGAETFRKPPNERGRRSPISKALLEAWVHCLDSLDQTEFQTLVERKDQLYETVLSLHADKTFADSISQGTGAVSKVTERFGRLEEEVRAVADAE
jgi:hypothetical protein